MSQSTAPLAPCTICRCETFQPGPLSRLSNTGRLPCCTKCGSLERHRIARRVMDLLPESLLIEKRVLQFSKDDSVKAARLAEHRVSEYGSSDSLDIQAIAVADGSYDWVVSHHVVNFVPHDDKALTEMLRVAGPNGAVLVTVGGTTDTFDTRVFDEPTGPHAAYKIYGSDFADRLQQLLPSAHLLEVVAIDPCTATLDVVYVYSRRVELLREVGRALAPHNLFARLSVARAVAAPPAAAPGAPTPPTPAAAPNGSPAANGSAARALPHKLSGADAAWQPLVDELLEWKKFGFRPRFWLRDDDATWANPRLEALWKLCSDSSITLACAAIPDTMEQSLVNWAEERRWLVMLQHGFDHVSRSGTPESSEFPDSRDLTESLRSIKLGQDRMLAFKSRQLPVFVPPWGRISAKVVAELGSAGFVGVSSAYLRRAPREGGISVANTHVLIPRKTQESWCFEVETAVSQLVGTLSAIRARGDADPLEPIGINTHHLSVGDPELTGLSYLFGITRECGADWLHPVDVFGSFQPHT